MTEKVIVRVCKRNRKGEYHETKSFTLKTRFSLQDIASHLKKYSEALNVPALPCVTTSRMKGKLRMKQLETVRRRKRNSFKGKLPTPLQKIV